MNTYSVVSPLSGGVIKFCPDGPYWQMADIDKHVNLCEPGYVVVEHLSERSRSAFYADYFTVRPPNYFNRNQRAGITLYLD